MPCAEYGGRSLFRFLIEPKLFHQEKPKPETRTAWVSRGWPVWAMFFFLALAVRPSKATKGLAFEGEVKDIFGSRPTDQQAIF